MNKKETKTKEVKVCEHMYSSDFETTTEKINKTKTGVYIAGLLNCETNKVNYSYSIEQWWQQCKTLPNNAVVFFHNLTFDGEFILHYLLKEGYNPVSGFITFEHKRSIKLSNGRKINPTHLISILQDSGGTIYQITVETKETTTSLLSTKNKWKRITFKCSYNLVNMSLDNWSKALKMKTTKQTLDYDKYTQGDETIKTDKKLHEYLKADLTIVSEGVKLLYQKVTNNGTNKKLFGLTSGSISLKLFRHYTNQQDIEVNKNIMTKETTTDPRTTNFNKLFNWVLNGWNLEEHTLITDMFYRGGYTNGKTEIIDKWVKTSNGISVDVNSLYPSVMKNNKMPCCKKLSLKEIKKHNIKDYYHFLLIEIEEFTPKQKNQPELIKNILRSSTRLKYNLKNVRYLNEWTNDETLTIGFVKEELDFIKKHYNIKFKVIKEFYTAKTNIISEYIKAVEKEKTEAKTPAERFTAKLKQNQLYGKFGQKANRESYHYIESQAKSIIDIDYSTNKQIYRRKETPEVQEHILSYPLVACVVTALARVELWTLIFDNIDIWLYSDTDSCYFSNTPQKIEIDEVKYGAWKVEKQFSDFKWIRAKCYGLKNIKTNCYEFTISGLNKKAKSQVNKDNFKKGLTLEDSKLMKKRVEGGIILTEVDYTITKNIITAEPLPKIEIEKIKKNYSIIDMLKGEV